MDRLKDLSQIEFEQASPFLVAHGRSNPENASQQSKKCEVFMFAFFNQPSVQLIQNTNQRDETKG